MSSPWIRSSVVLLVVAAFAGGAWALASPVLGTTQDRLTLARNPFPDTTSCRNLQYYCTQSCEDSPYTGHGVCRQGRGGSGSLVSVQCCCCTDGWQGRFYSGG